MISKKLRLHFLFLICGGAFLFSFFGCEKSDSLSQARHHAQKAKEEFQKAVASYEHAAKSSQNPDAISFLLAKLYFDHADYNSAIRTLIPLSQDDAKKLLAIAYFKDARYTDALTLFHSVGKYKTHELLENSFPTQQRRYDDRREEFSCQLGQKSDDAYLYHYGLTCEYHNLYDEALKVYQKISSGGYKSQAEERIRMINESQNQGDANLLNEETQNAIKNAPEAKDFPQAGAVTLFVKEDMILNADATMDYTQHYLIKILNDRGRKYGEITFGYDSTYDKVKIESARVIRPDGKIISVGAKHIRDVSRYTNFPLYSNARVRIISMPEISEGAFIEYQVRLTRGRLMAGGEFSEEYFLLSNEPVKYAKFRVLVPEGKTLGLRYLNEEYNSINADLKPHVEKEAGRDIYTWEFRDIPQIIPEPAMPPFVEITPLVMLSTFQSWDQIYRWWMELAKDKVDLNDEMTTKINALTQNQNIPKDKARALYNFCAKEIRYVAIEYGQAGYEPHRASEIFSNKYGDCKDKSILLIAMLKNIGVKAYPVIIATRGVIKTQNNFPTMIFNHVITMAELDGEQIFLDPTAETTLFGDLPESDQDRRVLVFRDDKPEFITTPKFPADHNRYVTKTTLTFQGDETVDGVRQVETQGTFDQSQRYYFRYTMPKLIEEGIKERIADIVPGARLKNYHVDNHNGMEKNILLSYEFTGTDFLIKAGKEARVIPRLASVALGLVAKDSRQYKIDFHIPKSNEDVTTIKIPESYRLKFLPESLTKETPWFKYENSYRYDNGTIRFAERTVSHAVDVEVKDYLAYKKMIEDLSRDVRQCIILEKDKTDAKQKTGQKRQ